jgi:hypothetical protein
MRQVIYSIGVLMAAVVAAGWYGDGNTDAALGYATASVWALAAFLEGLKP